MMSVRIVDVDDTALQNLIGECARCVYWEHPDLFRKISHEEGARLKAEWFSARSAELGSCGKALYVGDEPAAYCQYAPPAYLPGQAGYPNMAAHLDRESFTISCLCVRAGYQRQGLGKRLLAEVVADLRGRGIRAVETFARDDSADNCSGITAFYLSQGFNVVATEVFPNGAHFSLVRLELGG
jgi:ribosomal protein S18 acetylase RimI-like enzyme